MEISQTEKDFIRQSCVQQIRCDGRTPIDFRSVNIENDILPHCNGSCRVSIRNAIDIICGVKLSVVTDLESSNYISVTADLSPSCSSKYDESTSNAIISRIEETLESNIRNSCLQHFINVLTIIPGKYSWSLQIDLIVLEMDGNPLDACSWAVYSALQCTKIPSTEVYKGESGQLEDFEIASDMCRSTYLFPSESPVPITVTISKIADNCPLLLDATANEEACVLASMVVSMSSEKKYHTIRKFGGGHLNSTEVSQALQYAKEASSSIYPQLDSIRNLTLQEDKLYPDIPPVRLGLLA